MDPIARSRRWLPMLGLALALPVAAQNPPPRTAADAAAAPRVARPDATDAAAAVPAVVHRSSLAQYRRYAEQPVLSWREANELVNRIGGWRAYAREAAAPPASAASGAGR